MGSPRQHRRGQSLAERGCQHRCQPLHREAIVTSNTPVQGGDPAVLKLPIFRRDEGASQTEAVRTRRDLYKARVDRLSCFAPHKHALVRSTYMHQETGPSLMIMLFTARSTVAVAMASVLARGVCWSLAAGSDPADQTQRMSFITVLLAFSHYFSWKFLSRRRSYFESYHHQTGRKERAGPQTTMTQEG